MTYGASPPPIADVGGFDAASTTRTGRYLRWGVGTGLGTSLRVTNSRLLLWLVV